MKSKAPLALMEQLVMVLVFALAAALCLQVFVLSDQMSRRGAVRDQAVVRVQNAAEMLKSCGGDLEKCADLLGGSSDGTQWQVAYDAGWQQTNAEESTYLVQADLVDEDEPLLGSAVVSAQAVDGDMLVEVTVSWQEVAAHG